MMFQISETSCFKYPNSYVFPYLPYKSHFQAELENFQNRSAAAHGYLLSVVGTSFDKLPKGELQILLRTQSKDLEQAEKAAAEKAAAEAEKAEKEAAAKAAKEGRTFMSRILGVKDRKPKTINNNNNNNKKIIIIIT
jgi:hypothetical protein